MLSSILHAWRSRKSAKRNATLAIRALAAGMGSATAIYAVVEAALLRPRWHWQGRVRATGAGFGDVWVEERTAPIAGNGRYDDLTFILMKVNA